MFKNIKRLIKEVYNDMTLASKIRSSYVLIVVPMLIFLTICFFNLWSINHRYGEMVESAGIASEFSLDFKKDFDYETYLLIVENKTIEESELSTLLNEANRIVSSLEALDENAETSAKLKSVKKYLSNLETYKSRIEENLRVGNRYEDNIEIWENDVQIVTDLLRDSMMEYIYSEIQDIETTRESYQSFYMGLIMVMLAIFILITIAIVFLSFYIPLSITKPITKLSQVADQVANGDLTVRAGDEAMAGREVTVLGESLNAMIDKVNGLLAQVTKEQISLRKAELELLQAQINPHFLYNTLDAIVWLAEAGEKEKVVAMVGSLSDFFRTSLNQGKDVITIREEMVHVVSYLKIQQVRYQDILSYEIDVDEELFDCQIPKITIQPLVENALYHGIKNKRGGGKITVSGGFVDGDCMIRVQDNGMGMTPERLMEVKEGIANKVPEEARIYGIFNVNERIRLKFGDKYGISVDSVYGEGTSVTVRLPL